MCLIGSLTAVVEPNALRRDCCAREFVARWVPRPSPSAQAAGQPRAFATGCFLHHTGRRYERWGGHVLTWIHSALLLALRSAFATPCTHKDTGHPDLSSTQKDPSHPDLSAQIERAHTQNDRRTGALHETAPAPSPCRPALAPSPCRPAHLTPPSLRGHGKDPTTTLSASRLLRRRHRPRDASECDTPEPIATLAVKYRTKAGPARHGASAPSAADPQ